MNRSFGRIFKALLCALCVAAASASPLDQFFNLAPGTLSNTYTATNGSGLFRVLDAPAGEVLSFSWAYKAGDYSPYSDSAFVVVNGQVTTLASTSFSAVNPTHRTGQNLADGQYTGIMTTSIALPSQGGPTTIGFGVVNSIDTLYDPTLILFDVSFGLSGIPNGDFNNGLQGWQAPAFGGTVASGDILFPAYGEWDPFLSVGGLRVILGSSDRYAVISPANGLAAFLPGIPGESPENPLLPGTTTPGGWFFNNVESGLWIDPPFVNGFTYNLSSGYMTSINFPGGAGYESFTNLSISSPQCAGLPQGSFGHSLTTTFSFVDFGCTNVSTFSVFSNNPIFDFGDQQGFPLQLFFSGASATNIAMTPYDPNPSNETVPEPSTFAVAAIGLYVIARQARKRK